MKNIKNLGIKTKEGFEVKNYKRFPSMEWGEDGGMTADIYYKGKLVGNIFQEGNGGCSILHTYKCDVDCGKGSDCAKDLIACLKRLDYDYSENGRYEWLKNKTDKDINDDDFEALVYILAYKRDMLREIKRHLKTHKVVYVIYNKDDFSYLLYHVEDITDNEAKDFLAKKNITFTDLVRYDTNSNLAII